MLGRPVRSSLVLEWEREEQRAVTLVADSTSAAWEQRVKQGALSVSYGFRFERNHTFDTSPSINPDFPAFDLSVHISRFTTSVTWDSRDDAADATRGLFASSSFEHAAKALGSDFWFLRSLSQAYRFQSWRSVVFASAFRLGMERPLGGQDLIPSQRFFLGGARSVRGVAEDSLGERDIFGLPAGGQALLAFNQEARFPIYKWVRGVAFVDAGNVFARTRDIDPSELVGSAGLGLRLATPFVLLRVDYGKTFWNGPVAGSGRWVFGIGQTF
jgi:outer membrane protein assembly factor BamA